jgi:hypothetical protein
VTGKNIIVPAAVFAAFAVLYIIITLIGGSDLLFRPVWDIGHYLTIARSGYEVHPCNPAVDYPVGRYCGNVGWFPAWPLALRILSLGQVEIGILIWPYVFCLLGFVLFYNILRLLANTPAAIMGTVALASLPGAFYFLTGFPYGFMLALFSLYLYYLYHPQARGRMYILPIIAVIISLSYPSAFLTAIIPFVLVIREYFRNREKRSASRAIGNLAYYIVPFALGPLLLSLYFYLKFDDFLLILHFQEKYARQWNIPLAVIWQSLRDYPALSVENAALIYYGLIFIVFARYRTRPELVGYFVLFYLFSPTTGSLMSVYRHYLLLFPAAMVIGASDRPLWVKISYMALGLLLSLLRYYPVFMNGRLI